MNLKHIEAFNAIMITGSASAAGKLLNISQSAVTQTVQHAELRLGYQLFSRQSNRLVPTGEAHSLYPEVQKVIQQLESVRRLAQSLNGGGESQIKILITPSLATNVLPRALSAFRNKFPKISISIRTLHSGEIAKAIALQEGDVGIVYGSQGHPALIEEKIAVGKLVYLSGAGRGGIGRKTISLEEVVRNPFIRIHENDHLGAMLAAQCLHLGYRLEGGIAVQTHHIAMVLAEQGFGPAVVDSFTAFTSKTKLDLKILMPEIPVEICSLISRGAGLANSSAFFIEAFKAVASTHWFDADD